MPDQIMYGRPTDTAQFFFSMAIDTAHRGIVNKKISPDDLSYVLRSMAEGLQALSVGLRATYMELEELKKMVKAR